LDYVAIPPVALLDDIGGMQGRHLCLAHVCEQSPDVYGAWYARASRDRHEYVTLDNGAFELGASVADELLLRWMANLVPTEVVIPDVLGDIQATVSRGRAFVEKAEDTFQASGGLVSGYLAVGQGRTFNEWCDCVRALLEIPRVNAIGIVEETADWFPTTGGRLALIRTVESWLRPRAEIHLLGTDESFAETRAIAKACPWVRSTDSGKSTVYALSGHRLDIQDGPKIAYPGRPKDFFECAVTHAQREDAIWNAACVRAWCKVSQVVLAD